MKLLTKLTLFITLSKLAIVVLFVFLLPNLIERIASRYTDDYLREQKKKVMNIISKNGIDYYLQGEESMGSYTMLKEEYISLSPSDTGISADTIETSRRIVEGDTLNYRLLTHNFLSEKKPYLLEIGKTTATISQYNRPLQKIASWVLVALILFTLVADLIYTRFLLAPLGKIIKSKLLNRRFPFNDDPHPVRTSTSDFQYLDSSLMTLMNQIHEAFEKEREFTANASHELMTPISILQNKIENLLGETEVSDLVQSKLIEMHRTLNRLKKIVNSLLLISRIDNKQFARSEVVSLKGLLEDVMDDIGHRLEEKDIRFRVSLKNDISLKNCNRDLLYQLFYNLINNAIKYNKPQGEIIIQDSYHSGSFYQIFIEDTGIGIPAEDIPTIFNRFKKSNLAEAGGFGLGLSIVKSIASYHKINVDVSSIVMKGTTFTLVFPKEIIY
ncbi:sensor histidine kinase [Desertivirga brevis]|uniref:sensor histidine kinase n=1 Tax=Desertivirga brevis TaxID=2810310 RepID=UPI001A971046|nr:HAMP domain-containing sensor histidine kinase [Pedobacter sp. SYSU D00873]